LIDDAILGTVPANFTSDVNEPSRPEAKRRWLKIFLRVVPYVLAFILLGWALWKNRASIVEVIGRAPDVRYLFLAFLLGELALTSTFTRWYLLARAQRLPLTLREAFRIGFLGHASELVVPGQLGGDVVKAAVFCRGQAPKAQVIASIMFDRVTGVFGLFLLVSFMGALQWPTATGGVRRMIETVWAVTGAGAIGFAALFLPATSVLVRRILGGGRLSDKLARLWEAAAAYRGHKVAVATALTMAMVSHLIYALAFYAVSRALFPVTPPLTKSLVIIPLILFTAIVPLPFGALGVGEQVSDELFRMIGHTIGTPVMIGARVVGLAVSCVSILVYLANAPTLSQPEAALARAEPLEEGQRGSARKEPAGQDV
jgi:glycosyltransferase 2 family protein